jgi:hypothetical protein
MRKLRALILPILLFCVAAAQLSCGSNSGLQSITIAPASADAKNFPSGQVPFTATGVYAGSSQSVPVSVLWWNEPPWAPVAATPSSAPFDITAAGIATCVQGASGTFTVWATAPVDRWLPASQMTADTPRRTATAQITCP